MNLYFTYDSRDTLKSFSLFLTDKITSKLIIWNTVLFSEYNLAVDVHVLQTTQNSVISRCSFVENGKASTAIVLLIKSFV